ncbi:Asp23/Gls24 family envelope stress response protein [Virgibacillus sp. W0430]|uniref:Asp23/Gls24 family envelope stress response protein n=1 Tax=Virgibacillus sp. W0430 TaxID=3391580 RepID=UPI003F469D0E
MDDQPLLNVSNNPDLGKVEIAPEVIEVITGIAASEVGGVSAMRGNFATGVVERLGKKAHNKGVKVDLTDDGIVIDLYVVLHYGVTIPEIAQKLQSTIRQSLKSMTALEIAEINIHVVGIQMDNTANADASNE